MTKSDFLFKEAVQYIPGGVNSPVRAFTSVGMAPRFIKSADGAYLTDVDDNCYLDYVCSWGPMILGHAHPKILAAVSDTIKSGLSFGAATEKEVEMAKLICELVPSIEMVRMVNSGTEAVMSAVRAARGYTGRNKIIKFFGCYHGHSDGLLVKAGSGLMTEGIPDSSGVPAGCTKDTLTAIYNDLESVRKLMEKYNGEIAAVIVEPIAANMGVVLPQEGFLSGLRSLCNQHDALLIFDEVITGFRIQIDGAQGYYSVTPDLTTFGKIIGGGMPVGAYGGRKDVMEMISPAGPVYQAGTLSGNPVAMAAGIMGLQILKDNPEIYNNINKSGTLLFTSLNEIIQETGANCSVNHIGSLGSLFFTKNMVTDYTTAKTSDTQKYAAYFKHLLSHGIYTAPSQFEAMFLSNAHTEDEIQYTLQTARKFFQSL